MRQANRSIRVAIVTVVALVSVVGVFAATPGAIPSDATYSPDPFEGPPGTTITADDPVGCTTPNFDQSARLALWDPTITTQYDETTTTDVSGPYQLSLPAPDLPAGSEVLVILNCLGTGGSQGSTAPTFTVLAGPPPSPQSPPAPLAPEPVEASPSFTG